MLTEEHLINKKYLFIKQQNVIDTVKLFKKSINESEDIDLEIIDVKLDTCSSHIAFGGDGYEVAYKDIKKLNIIVQHKNYPNTSQYKIESLIEFCGDNNTSPYKDRFLADTFEIHSGINLLYGCNG